MSAHGRLEIDFRALAALALASKAVPSALLAHPASWNPLAR